MFLMVFYFLFIVIFIEPVNFSVKIAYVLMSLTFIFILALISFAFRDQINTLKNKIFKVFYSGEYYKSSTLLKIYNILSLAIMILLMMSLLEFVLTIFFTNSGAITFGFPLPVYSFSARKFLLINILIDIFLLMSVTYLIGISIANDRKGKKTIENVPLKVV